MGVECSYKILHPLYIVRACLIGRLGDTVHLQHGHRLLDLGLEGLLILNHVQELGVLDLQQHASDLAGQTGMHALDHRVQALSEDLLLLLWLGISQKRSNKLLGIYKKKTIII